ncbi:MAG: HipA N-terminal domain-containing protein, partial [Sphingobacterium thalpophilum]
MKTAYVKIWGELVGAVAWDDAAGYATFEYDSKFKSKGWELAPLQMPIKENKSSFNFPALRKRNDP